MSLNKPCFNCNVLGTDDSEGANTEKEVCYLNRLCIELLDVFEWLEFSFQSPKADEVVSYLF